MSEPTEASAVAKCANKSCETAPSANFSACGGCKKVRYCSKPCQTQHWRQHKFFCKHISTGGASSASLDMVGYFEKVAGQDPKAQALAHEIGLALPGPDTPFQGLKTPMHRLVAAGRDTPENLALLFGRGGGEVDQVHGEERMEVLLAPPRGSPMYAFARGLGVGDDGGAAASPRAASADEQRRVREVRAMQETIRRHMGPRGVADVSASDMREILVANFGNRWSEMLPTYTLALNSMDRGVRVD